MMWRFWFSGLHQTGGWLFSAISCFIMMALVVLAIVMLVRLIRRSGRTGSEQSNVREDANALRILNERFAKGEINEEEYTKMKETLRKP